MSYELTIIPMGYSEHIKEESAFCIHCDTKLDLIDHFCETKDFPVEHDGLLYACCNCGANHLELLNSSTEFESPIIIEWN